MKVFISWSGDLSHSVAVALRDWLPSTIQAITPYVSSEDIDKGARWSSDVSRELEKSEYGILCITPDNVEAPWINFEAGALSKSLERSRVAPFLLRMKPTDLKGPLVQFQSTAYQKEDVYKLLGSLNKACGDAALDDARLEQVFEVWWPLLDAKLEALGSGKIGTVGHPRRTTEDMVAEILDLVRSQEARVRSSEDSDFSGVAREARSRTPAFSRAALNDLAKGWDSLLAYAQTRPEGSPDLEETLKVLRTPVTYLLRKRGMSYETRMADFVEVRRFTAELEDARQRADVELMRLERELVGESEEEGPSGPKS
jgi:hypothetical protein